MRRLATLTLTLALVGLAAPSRAGGAGVPLDLATKLNSECIAMANVIVDADCAADRTSAYVEETMPKPGLLTVAGTTFRWPASGLGTRDTVLAASQEIKAPAGAKGHRSVAALLAAHDGTVSPGRFVVRYTDGSKADLPFKAYNYKHGKAESFFPDVRVQYFAHTASNVVFGGEGSLQLVVMPIDPKKTVKSVVLPGMPKLMVFAVSLSPLTSAPKPPKRT